MTKQDKKLLLVDLCARLPYGFKYQVQYGDTSVRDVEKFILDNEYSLFDAWMVHEIKPYLRPMSNMTKKEMKEYSKFAHFGNTLGDWTKSIDYLYTHHIDFRGWIKKGLALPAPEGMYNFK